MRPEGRNGALSRRGADQGFALEDRVPHKGGPLSKGIVHGCRVTCPLHNMVIELESGAAVAPDEGAVTRFSVKVEAGKILMQLDGETAESVVMHKAATEAHQS